MKAFNRPRFASWLVAAAVAILLAACGKPSDRDTIAAAHALIEQRNLRAAVVSLKAALQKQPESAPLRFLLGKTLLDGGDPVTALVELRKALELGHAETEVLPELVKAMAASGRAAEATKQYAGKQLDGAPAMAELQVGLAAAWGIQGRSDLMRESIDKALALDPQNITAQLVKARLIAATGDLDASWRMNEAVLHKQPKNAQALHLKGLLLRYLKNDVQAAQTAQRAALDSDATLMPAHAELLGLLFAAKDKDGMRKQMAAMQKALPQNLNTFLFRAQIEYLENNLRAARELVQQLLRAKQPDTRVLLLAAQIELRHGALTLSETYLTRALNEEPNLETARELLAVTYLRMGHHTKALTMVQPLIERDNPPARYLALAADAYLQGGNPARAQGLFERAAKSSPEDPRLRTAVALSRIAQGKVTEGLADLDRVADSDPGTFADLALISTLMRRNDVSAALAAVDRLERKEAKQPRFAHIRGQIHQHRKDLPAARQSFAQALALDPVYFPAAFSLASIDVAENKLGDAKKHFEAILVRDPKNVRAMLALADLKSRNGDPDIEVQALLQEAVKSNPTEVGAREALIEFHLHARRYDDALSAAQQALSVMADSPGLLDGLGRAQFGTKEYQQAITTFRKMATLMPNSAQAHLRLADVYAARNERAAATASLQRALEIAPDLVSAQARQAQLLLADKQYKQALAIARRVQQARPRDGIGHLLEADVLLSQKQLEGAATALRGAMSRSPSTEAVVKLHSVLLQTSKVAEAEKLAGSWSDQHPQDVVFRAYLGSAAMKAKDWARAERLYRDVTAAQPKDVTANNNLAWALMNQKKPGALPFAEAANKQSPNLPPLMDTLAAAMADAGQVAKALELQKKVVDMAPQLLEAKLTLARIAIQAGNKVLARAELEKLTYEGERFAAQVEVQQLLRSIQ